MLKGKLHIVLWFTAIVVHLILLLAAWDMFPAKSNYPQLYTPRERRHAAGGRRAVIFLVGALNATAFYRTMNSMEYSLINSIVIETGSWGITWSTDTRSTDNLRCLLSGTIIDDIPWFNTSFRQPDYLTNYMKEIVYIGPPSVTEQLPIDTANWQIHTYPDDWDLFTRKYNDVAMDTWVTEHTKTILNNEAFRNSLPNDKTLFLIYFNGVKIINKYEGKYSPRISNAVSRILVNVESLVYSFKRVFNDDETLYILASDYTTSDIKEYVKDGPAYVATPILAWGAQISGQLLTKSKDWPLLVRNRKDIDHKDLSTLLACILGVPTPAHSIGQLPFTYLQNNASLIARCALSNIKQLQTLYNVENENVNRKALLKISNLFAPIDRNIIDNLYKLFIKNIDRDRYNMVLDESESLIMRIIYGIKHYKYYYSRLAKVLIVSFYSCWLIFLSSNLIRLDKTEVTRSSVRAGDSINPASGNIGKKTGISPEAQAEHRKSFWKRLLIMSTTLTCLIDSLYVSFSLLSLTLAILAAWPIRLIIYLLALLCIWWTVYRHCVHWFSCRKFIIARTSSFSSVKFCAFLLLLILTCCLFLNNIVLAIIMLLIMLVLPFADYKDVKNCYLGDWMLSSILLMFSLCYSSGLSTNLSWIIMQTSFWVLFSLVTSAIFQIKLVDYPLIVLSLIGIMTATITNCLLKEQLITDNIWLWLLTLSFIMNIFVGSNSLIIRLIQNGNCLCIPYVLKAKGYEPLTYLSIIIHLTTWIAVETYNKDNDELKGPIMQEMPTKIRMNSRQLEWNDLRRAFICIIYLLVCYLAMDNPKNIVNLFTNLEISYSYTNLAPLMIHCIKLLSITLTVIMFYLVITKTSSTSMKIELLCLLTLMAFMGFLLLIVALAMNTYTANILSVSDYIFSQFLVLAFLITYPVNLCLTSTSLLKLTSLYNEALSPIIIPRNSS